MKVINTNGDHKEFLPEALVEASAEDKWQWYQQRNLAEERLKVAISNREVCYCHFITTIRTVRTILVFFFYIILINLYI